MLEYGHLVTEFVDSMNAWTPDPADSDLLGPIPEVIGGFAKLRGLRDGQISSVSAKFDITLRAAWANFQDVHKTAKTASVAALSTFAAHLNEAVIAMPLDNSVYEINENAGMLLGKWQQALKCGELDAALVAFSDAPPCELLCASPDGDVEELMLHPKIAALRASCVQATSKFNADASHALVETLEVVRSQEGYGADGDGADTLKIWFWAKLKTPQNHYFDYQN